VAIILLSHIPDLLTKVFFMTGVKDKLRVIVIEKLFNELGTS